MPSANAAAWKVARLQNCLSNVPCGRFPCNGCDLHATSWSILVPQVRHHDSTPWRRLQGHCRTILALQSPPRAIRLVQSQSNIFVPNLWRLANMHHLLWLLIATLPFQVHLSNQPAGTEASRIMMSDNAETGRAQCQSRFPSGLPVDDPPRNSRCSGPSMLIAVLDEKAFHRFLVRWSGRNPSWPDCAKMAKFELLNHWPPAF